MWPFNVIRKMQQDITTLQVELDNVKFDNKALYEQLNQRADFTSTLTLTQLKKIEALCTHLNVELKQVAQQPIPRSEWVAIPKGPK